MHAQQPYVRSNDAKIYKNDAKIWKLVSAFCVDSRKDIGKNSAQGGDLVMSNKVILNFMPYNNTII